MRTSEALLDHPPRNGEGLLPIPRLTAVVTQGKITGRVSIPAEPRRRRVPEEVPDVKELKRRATRAAAGKQPGVNYCSACGGAGHHRNSKRCPQRGEP